VTLQRWPRLAALVLVGSLLSVSQALAGPWYKAETDRFIVYGETFEGKVRAYASRLQTYDAVLRLFHPDVAKRVPSTKLNVVMIESQSELEQIWPGVPGNVLGFYNPNNEGLYAVVLTTQRMGEDDVLFHEYAHHFMRDYFPSAYPAWFVEGFAEYFGMTTIEKSSVSVGGENNSRAGDLLRDTWIPLSDLFGKSAWQISAAKRSNYYALSWLMTHYMRSDAARGKQLFAIVQGIANGQDPVTTVERETGMTLEQLTKTLKAYNRFRVATINGEFARDSDIVVTKMPDSTDDFMYAEMRLKLRSSAGDKDDAFVNLIRNRAKKWPGDPTAEIALARTEFVMGDIAAGEAIVNRRLQANPNDKETVLLAGMGQYFAGLRAEKDKKDAEKDARFRAARPILMNAYRLDDQDFRPLYAYVETRTVEPNFPNDRDVDASAGARDLAPAVHDISHRLGLMLIKQGRLDDAKIVWAPLINNPHGGAQVVFYKSMLDGKTEKEAEAAAKAAAEAAKTR
jgi:hypothetical protein